MIDLDDLKKRAESAVGFVDVYLAPDVVLEMIAEIKALRDEVSSDNKIIEERDRLLNMFECPEHGQCVPFAMEQVTALRKDAMRYQWLRDSSESIHQFYLSTPIWFLGVKFSKENVDRTIDSAMEKEAT